MIRRLVLPALVALAAVAGCASRGAPPAPPAAVDSGPRVVASNVERRDYAGSAACAPCHAKIYEKWKASPMRNMTRLAADGVSRAPFDGAVFGFKGDRVVMEQHEDRRYMRVEAQGRPPQLFLVTKVIGGRYREDFVGREVAGTEQGSPSVSAAGEEPILPVSYLLFSKSWRYKGYSVMVKERPHLGQHGAPWRQTCIFCHNTAPYLATIYDDLLGGGRPYQGSVSDRLLPPDRLWSTGIADAAGLGRALDAEVTALGGPALPQALGVKEALGAAVAATWDGFGEKQLVEVGIGCEACHNGSREHAEDPTRKPSFSPRSAFLSTSAPSPVRKGPEPSRAETINHTCARCHTVLFSRYPYTWEGGLRPRDNTAASASKRRPPGGSAINSGEARDFLLGGCASAMSCTDCHDPHTEDCRADLERLGTVAGNGVCQRCHQAFGTPEALRAHTHHAPEGEGSACLACHMPKKNAGLNYRLTRYHRIGSPTEDARVEGDRPLECALCHADKSVGSLVETMESWWKKRYDRRALHRLYGEDLGVNPLYATLAVGHAHEQMTAAGVLGERGEARAAAPALVPLLSSDYPLVRYWAREAIEKRLGAPLAVDVDGEVGTILVEAREQVERALAGKK